MNKLTTLVALLLLFAYSCSSVHAQVTFANIPWEKTQILAPTPTDRAVSEPSVLYENGVWRMWYRVGWGNNLQGIYYATSSNGIHWIKYGHVTNDYNAHVYRYNSTTLLMAAHGLIDQYSQDGIHWSNFTQQYGLWPNPWLNQADPYQNEYGTIGNSQLLKLPNGTYLMYYESWNCNSQNKNPSGQPCYGKDAVWVVNQASSQDVFDNWARSPNNPLLSGALISFANPHVILENGTYYAFVDYYLWNATLGARTIIETLLTSIDGTHFTFVYGPTNPVLSIDAEKKLDSYCNQVGDAWVMVQPNGIYMFYDEDANVAANLTATHASIWLAFLPNTTLPQLASGQFGTNVSESVSEFPSPVLLMIGTTTLAVLLTNRVRRARS